MISIMDENKVIVCRCEDLTLSEIVEAIEAGYDSWDKLKRQLRVGMGPCGGKTCRMLVLRELSEAKGTSMSDLYVRKTVVRPPIRGIPFKALQREADL
jgi:NAD(P)H-nitrite reductase large subunit